MRSIDIMKKKSIGYYLEKNNIDISCKYKLSK